MLTDPKFTERVWKPRSKKTPRLALGLVHKTKVLSQDTLYYGKRNNQVIIDCLRFSLMSQTSLVTIPKHGKFCTHRVDSDLAVSQ